MTDIITWRHHVEMLARCAGATVEMSEHTDLVRTHLGIQPIGPQFIRATMTTPDGKRWLLTLREADDGE